MTVDEEIFAPVSSCLIEDQLRDLSDPELLEFFHAETIAPAPSKKAIWIEQWVRWNAAAASERRTQSLTPSEIGSLESLPRLLSQKYSVLDNLVSLMRQDPEADSIGAVLVLVTLLADNDKGGPLWLSSAWRSFCAAMNAA